jgi:hypothetical protein
MGQARLWAASGDLAMFKMEGMERNLTITDTRSLRDQVGRRRSGVQIQGAP